VAGLVDDPVGDDHRVWLRSCGAAAAHQIQAVAIDAITGLPAAIAFAGGVQALRFRIAVVEGGSETRGTYGGIDVTGARRHDTSVLVGHQPAGVAPAQVTTHVGPAELRWTYTFRDEAPHLAVTVEITSQHRTDLTVRDVQLSIAVPAGPLTATGPVVRAPGNRIRSGLPLAELDQPVTVNTAGGTPGSSGLTVLEFPDRGSSLVCWPLSRDAIGAQAIHRDGEDAVIDLYTGLAGMIHGDGALHYGTLYLDNLPLSWEAIRPRIPGWYRAAGIELPADAPDWAAHASIFEVQLGTSLFGAPANYSPYPDIADLIADLDRIAYLGFDTIQLMPRQPFPSYNVIDFADIAASYADPDLLEDLVEQSHRRGIRVILDVIMHGVIDKESIAQAADAVRQGPHGAYLATDAAFSNDGADALEMAQRLPWSRHILDFERAWSDGSPGVHPLVRDHPDWFFRDSHGQVAGIYTKAFDLAHPEVAQYFQEALVHFVERLGIDGFRFDAPTYNAFPNWSPLTRHRASASELACIDLFAKLRAALKPRYPELLFYTEPSGVLLRQSMDVNYNYDEHSQLEDLVGFRGVALGSVGESTTGVRNAAELAAWFDDRNACLPDHAITAHHIDSHDTFWWPRPGQKWRREQIALPATRALASIFALSGGPYMTFVGGELGIEEHLRVIHRLRRRPEIGYGAADYRAVRTDSPRVYAVVRSAGEVSTLVLVNMADRASDVTLTLAPFAVTTPVVNLVDDTAVTISPGSRSILQMAAFSTVLLALHTPGPDTPGPDDSSGGDGA